MHFDFSCKKKDIVFEIKREILSKSSVNKISSIITVLGVTVTAEGQTIIDAHRSAASLMLTKLGWNETNIQVTDVDESIKLETNTEEVKKFNLTSECFHENQIVSTRNTLLSPVQLQLKTL